LFKDVIQPAPQVRILDVGGNPWFWGELQVGSRITLLTMINSTMVPNICAWLKEMK